jgi:hypothetical protein
MARESPSPPWYQDGVWILAVKHPEAGVWTVTVDATASKGRATYSIDIRADDPVVEEAHLEVMPRDGNPRVVNLARPGAPVYVRVFVATDDRPLPGVRWNVLAHTPSDSVITVPVMDDGQHADGAAGDGIFVGAFIAEKGPIPTNIPKEDEKFFAHWLYQLRAEGQTPAGIRYVTESRIEIAPKSDLLIADSIRVSPDPRVGNPVTLTVTVKNDGVFDYRGVTLDLSLTAGRETWVEEVSRRTFDLLAGESRRITTSWTPHEAGEHGVRLTIYPFIEPEGDVDNNYRSTTVSVR